MKKLSLLLILLPIFLITSMNFYGGNTDVYHTEANKSLTCTACHVTVIGSEIIGGGKVDAEFLTIDVNIPIDIDYNGVSLNIEGQGIPIVNGVDAYLYNGAGAIFNLDINSKSKGKKENVIKIKYPVSSIDKETLEIQGVLSNLDGKPGGDYSFYKKIDFKEIQKEISVYPTIASEKVTIENITENALVQIYNTNGQIVYSQISQTNKESVNVSDFQNGNYFMMIQDGKTVSQSKFIVSK